MKLYFKGYILRRCDTNEYLAELVLHNQSAIAGWTFSKSNADLSKFRIDALTIGCCISEAIKVRFELSELFKFGDDYLELRTARYDPKKLVSELNSTQL